MKVCKKCKTHVANNAKICKKCGADVSKAKIIKTTNTGSKQKSTKTQVKPKTTPIAESKSKSKDKVVVTTKQSKKQPPKKQTSTKEKTTSKKQTPTKKTELKKKEQKTTTVKKNKKELSNSNTKAKKQQVTNDKKTLSKANSTIKKDTEKTFDILKDVFIYLGSEIYHSLKTTIMIILDIIKSIGKAICAFGNKVQNEIKKIYTKIQQVQKNKPKKNKEEKYVTYKLEDYEEQIPQKKKPQSHKNGRLKYAIIFVFITTVLLGLYFVGQDIYKDLTGTTNKVVVTEKATTEKVFSMEDIITYNNVDYKVVKIETSKGNSYKSPKAGHQFLIVTVYIKNNTETKIPYSYENWTMSNSKGEEKKRIFSSINVDTALYSGELVIGGIKTGSMVFEQPINDPKLKMNFYELKKDNDGNEVIDESKRVFSISVKVPKKKTKAIKEPTKEEDVKVVKTNDKNKS